MAKSHSFQYYTESGLMDGGQVHLAVYKFSMRCGMSLLDKERVGFAVPRIQAGVFASLWGNGVPVCLKDD